MAKRGRPTVKTREKDYIDWWSYTDSSVQGMLTGGAGRSMTNAYYSTVAIVIISEAATKFPEECTVPYWDEIEFKNCITEQLGRMIAQDHDEGARVVAAAQIAAEEYHNGAKAKDVTAWLRSVRKNRRE